ncbi:hypothetical protein [Hyphomicrobium sp.]|uniref:hypothetical protein n=1 Tax=Hyphomicrobium sp. TaxID=82 RepID=UPI002E321D14|nr:hypothetical protein [Hyphomicrobium sp.]HEX2840477.1 hypothetical protein [Hyphomicrobium sp.]
MTPSHQHYPRDLYFETFTLDVEPTDRVGAPLRNRHKAKLRGIFLGAVAAAFIWPFVAGGQGTDTLIESATSLINFVVSNARDIALRAAQNSAPTPAPPPSASAASPEFLQPLETAQTETTSPSASEEQTTASMGAAYSETPEPAEDAVEQSPKRAHAIAAGLSPDLPNVLLTRLSDSDLKNAAYAIKTALAKTPDDGTFSWPLTPTRQQALFEVRFVTGASEGCRRYIVSVTKDRWSSTSAALEKCGDAKPTG